MWDEEVFKDDSVAQGQTKLSGLCCDGGMDEWYPLFWKGKEAGKLHIKAEWWPADE